MSERELSPIKRFGKLWSAATLGGEFRPSDTNPERRREIPLEDGIADVRVHLQPYVIGSLRPLARMLQVVTPSGEVATLSEGQVMYSTDKEVIQNLEIMEKVLSF